MNKTITINLNGQNFIIEEEAYEKLLNYLNNIREHCGADTDADEVISDIENSIAEKLKSTLTNYKDVITEKNIDDIIKIMGTSEDFDREIGNLETKNNHNTNFTTRKLYRDTDNAIISGVAAGLGNYFDIDPVFIRVILCALVFAGGSGIIIYLILWITMPEAKTAHQKLEMTGQTPTIAAFKNLAKNGRKIKENWKNHWKKQSAVKKIISLPFIIIKGILQALKKLWLNLWPIIKIFFGSLMVLFSLIWIGVIGIGCLILFLYNNSTHQLLFIPISEIMPLFPYTLMIITGFLSLIIPAIFIIIGGLAIIRKRNIISFAVGSILVGLWMTAGIIFCSFSVRYFPDIINKYDNYPLLQQKNETINLEGITEIEANGNLINITISSNTSTPATLNGRQVDLNQIDIKYDHNKLILTEIPWTYTNGVCIDCHLNEVRLIIATSSDLKITANSGASIFDASDPKYLEEMEDEEIIEEENKYEEDNYEEFQDDYEKFKFEMKIE